MPSPSYTRLTNPSETPFGQTVIKLISNLCFSFFVLFVLILTLIAITYQPPDPWLSSSKTLISQTLTQTLPNSTFNSDDSVLTTGEDILISPSPSSVPESDPPTVTVITNKNVNRSCSDTLNCSDPEILSAIQRFNAKRYKGRIIFLSYELPLAGDDVANECDASWRFRNKKEKSWRRYRDYRRFTFKKGENCSFEIVKVGKFRSGLNAAPKRVVKPIGSNGNVQRPHVVDVDINDTISRIESESDFKKGKYLYYTRGGDYCKGMNQYLWSLLCGLGEAKFLNRTFVMDLNVCLSGSYSKDGKDVEGKDFRFYFDYEHLKESASVVEEHEFLKDWRRWDRRSGKKANGNGKIPVRKVPTYKVTPMQLKKDRSTIVWRQFDGKEPENYWYRVCEARAAKYIHRPWEAIWKSKRLMNIVTQISGKMEWDFDAVHVVRGWKAENKELWPHLDADTSPDAIVQKVLKIVKPWRNLYVATNEPFYNYFDKLRSHYKVHLLEDYKETWNNKSEWFNETMNLNGGKPVEFDGYMRVAVDTEVLCRAKTVVETFNNLTQDCKAGVKWCT